ncbi:ATP-grasp domain-containing protein [Methanothermobacter sp. THM-2]|uniref:ATP-grasp domain-containing protein n=1 Tax=Methanothermobacter sp. THM-2 TaxID=2606912 RepID=UPI00136618DE|nr:ATP-grasp domain-containing protein [Methanothermobacter sp. THM-2]QHN08022.1 ATP-grasp domain-containing protein [Methanothermobacter sp. THM-2]
MEKLLIIGVNTRPVAESAFRAGYSVYSASYYCTLDFRGYTERRCILQERRGESCGRFQENFSTEKLLEAASDFIGMADGIIPLTGAPGLPEDKVLGNTRADHVEDKYSLYQRIKNSYPTPETHLITDPQEALEIVAGGEKRYLIKPVSGAGGFGVMDFQEASGEFLLQEYIEGVPVSASVLSTGSEALTVLTSRQIIKRDIPGFEGQFIYAGNITPGPRGVIEEMAEDLILDLSLRGSNGVDFIIQGSEVYVVEVNPRIQGTFECAEASLGINMTEAHVMACMGELIEKPEPLRYAVKRILYAPSRCMVGEIKIPGVHDLPFPGAIIEEGEPLVTVLAADETPERALSAASMMCSMVQERLNPVISLKK